jgi:8-oxo-dGTP diphosphatase
MAPLDTTIFLATGILIRDDALLLVASRYANQPQPLWNLPGGRQEHGELLRDTVVREVFEETGLQARAREFAYLSESYDGGVHILNATFVIEAEGEPHAPSGGDHVTEVAWVPLSRVEPRIAVRVVREPLLAYLRGDLVARYAGYPDAGITIRWE